MKGLIAKIWLKLPIEFYFYSLNSNPFSGVIKRGGNWEDMGE